MIPYLAVVIVTYNRIREFELTLESLDKHIVYPKDKLLYFIADDCSRTEVQAAHRAVCNARGIRYMYVSGAENVGWGANVNRVLKMIFPMTCNYVYFTEDDYVVRKPLDLELGVALLEAAPHVGMLRYRGTAGSKIKFIQREAILTQLPDYVEACGIPGRATYLEIHPDSEDLYLYSHGPHLKRYDFHSYYGMYPEGLKLGHTEESYAHMVKNKYGHLGAPAIAILPDWVPLWFDHIGTSFQHTELDRGE